jgi:hypothetical protein
MKNMLSKTNSVTIFKLVKLCFMIVFPIILLIIPFNFFDSGLPPLCLSQILFKTECPGCGMTRACQRIIHFHFLEAWQFNKMSFIVFPVIAYLYVKDFLETYKN